MPQILRHCPIACGAGRLLVSSLTVPRQRAAILRWPAQRPRTRRSEQALAFAENYGQAGDTRVGCWRCPDGGVGFSACSANCCALRRLQMALVLMSSKLGPLVSL